MRGGAEQPYAFPYAQARQPANPPTRQPHGTSLSHPAIQTKEVSRMKRRRLPSRRWIIIVGAIALILALVLSIPPW